MIKHITVIKTGQAMQRPFWTKAGGTFRKKEYPIYCIELEHEKLGKILIDTGYGSQFLSRLASLPRIVYGKLFIEKEESVNEKCSIAVQTYEWVILSHFHPDHIGGLGDLNYRKLIISSEIEGLIKQPRIQQLRQGFFTELMPKSIEQAGFIEHSKKINLPELQVEAYDLFGDRSVCAIPMEGHAVGQSIFYVQTVEGPVLLAIDVAWHVESITEHRFPKIVTKLIVHDYKEMKRNIRMLAKIHQETPDLPIVLSHCQNSLNWLKRWDQENGGCIVDYQEN